MVFCSGMHWHCYAGLTAGAVQIALTAGLTPLEQVPKQVWSPALAVAPVLRQLPFAQMRLIHTRI